MALIVTLASKDLTGSDVTLVSEGLIGLMFISIKKHNWL